jgi:hypothetical protein
MSSKIVTTTSIFCEHCNSFPQLQWLESQYNNLSLSYPEATIVTPTSTAQAPRDEPKGRNGKCSAIITSKLAAH